MLRDASDAVTPTYRVGACGALTSCRKHDDADPVLARNPDLTSRDSPYPARQRALIDKRVDILFWRMMRSLHGQCTSPGSRHDICHRIGQRQPHRDSVDRCGEIDALILPEPAQRIMLGHATDSSAGDR